MTKKRVFLALTMVALVCGVIGCGKEDTEKKDTVSKKETTQVTKETTEGSSDESSESDKSSQEVCDELKDLMKLDELTKLDAKKIAYFYEMEESDTSDAAGYMSDVAVVDELVVMKASDEEQLNRLKNGANNRLKKQKEDFKDYIPEQAKRLDDAKIVTAGNYVMYVMSDQGDQIVKKFKELCE